MLGLKLKILVKKIPDVQSVFFFKPDVCPFFGCSLVWLDYVNQPCKIPEVHIISLLKIGKVKMQILLCKTITNADGLVLASNQRSA